jgi:hypothetical protein
MQRQQLWIRWLWAASLGLVLFGLAMALLNRTPVFDVFNRAIDPRFWPADIPPGVPSFQGWVYGAWGATVAGWGITVAFIVRFALSRRHAWGWWALVTGIGVWFVIDTALSALAGVWVNVGLNAFLLAVFTLPLAAGAHVWLKGNPEP